MSQPDDDRGRWNRRYESAGLHRHGPSPLLEALHADLGDLADGGQALDLAGGSGRNALWLAAQRWSVTLCDVSDVALSQARQHAAQLGLPLATVERDVLAQGPPPAPDGDGLWDLIVCFNFIHRGLYARLPDHLRPGGRLLIVHPTVKNLERHARPSARFLLREGELPALVQGVQVLRGEEGWLDGERHLSLLLAAKPPHGGA